MELIFLKSPKSLSPQPESGGESKMLYLCNNFRTLWALRDLKLPHVTVDGHLDEAGNIAVENDALRIATRWYKENGEDRSLFEGISLGGVCENDITGFAVYIIKFAFTLNKILSEHPILSIRTDASQDSLDYALLDWAARLRSIPLSREHSAADREDWTNFTSFYDACLFPEHHRSAFHKAVRRTLGRMTWKVFEWVGRSRQSRWNGGAPSVLVQSSGQLDCMLEAWRAQGKPWPLILDVGTPPHKALFQRLLRSGAALLPHGARLSEERTRQLEGVIRRCEDILRNPSDSALYLCQSLDLRLIFGSLIRRWIVMRWPALGLRTVGLRAAIENRNIGLVVVPNDVSESQKMTVLTARSMGISSLVMQHGYHGAKIDQDKKFADHLAVWGEAVKRAYVEDGVPEDKITVTGCPVYDRLPSFSDTTIHENSGVKRKRRLLFVTTNLSGLSAGSDINLYESMVVSILEALRPYRDSCDLTIKIHPGEHAGFYRRILERVGSATVRLSRHGNSYRLIAESDLILCTPTTMALEAALYEKPVLCLNYYRERNPPPLDGQSGIPVISDDEELVKHLGQFFACPTFSQPGSAEVSGYLGEVRGHATRKLLKLVGRLLSIRGGRIGEISALRQEGPRQLDVGGIAGGGASAAVRRMLFYRP